MHSRDVLYHTHRGVGTPSPHVFPQHRIPPPWGPTTRPPARALQGRGNVLGVLLWGFFPSREMVVGADRGRLRHTQVVEGLAPREAPQRPRGVTDALGQADTMKC